ncbi:MAG TPA: multicopper oxidase [Blastocatellia bacterium]|nr:multicopper oxidase [Blastocatellia bacterium]
MSKKMRILSVFFLSATIALPWTVRFTVAAQQGKMMMSHSHQSNHRNSKHMHMKNWALEPTGIAGVTPLDPTTIPKFKNQLIRLPTFVPIGTKREPSTGRNLPLYEVIEQTVQIPLLPPGFPTTKSYAYGGKVNIAGPGQQQNIVTAFSVPGPTFEAVRNQRIFVHYINDLDGPHMFPVDPTIMAANVNNSPIPTPPFKPFPPGYQQFQDPIATVPHLHGGVTPSDSDGFPRSWFTKGLRRTGETFSGTTFEYFNGQLPTTLWYHDHALGMTRLNVAAGLEGTYIIRDPNDNVAPLLPQGRFEVPLFIMDKAFNSDGSIHFTQVGDNPDIHPYWDPEYFGDTILVNGKVWPNFKVERRQYRFRIVNGSNARFYNLQLSNGQSFIQIGADGSYLPAPVAETEALLAPCERADILIDFSILPPGTKIILQNTANAPFPGGDPVDPNTTGVVMQFEVLNTPAVHPRPLPATLITVPTLIETPDIGNPKLFTLNEQESATGDPVAVLIDGQHFDADITEIPRVGTTESWYFQNLTEDAHPIHIHLVEFQLEDRQNIDVDRFTAYWQSLNGTTLPLDHPTVRANVETAVFDPATRTTHDFLTGPSEPPSPQESGWKDVFIAPPGKVTRILLRIAPQSTKESDLFPGKNAFPFDPTAGPGYVWHCHILDHEDNDMMRPMKITNDPPTVAKNPKAVTKRRPSVSKHSEGGQHFR